MNSFLYMLIGIVMGLVTSRIIIASFGHFVIWENGKLVLRWEKNSDRQSRAYELGYREGYSQGPYVNLSEKYLEMKCRADRFHRRAQLAESVVESFMAHVAAGLEIHRKHHSEGPYSIGLSWLDSTKRELEKDFQRAINRYRRKSHDLANGKLIDRNEVRNIIRPAKFFRKVNGQWRSIDDTIREAQERVKHRQQ